jgi:HlyD family secretion protein
MRKINVTWIFMLLLIMLTACREEDHQLHGKKRVITVARHPVINTLYYVGTVQPLQSTVVTSRVDGVIEEMFFHYGDNVQPGQVLFTIHSEKFQSDYKVALMDYLKAKNDFNDSHNQLVSSQFLHKHELISDDDYKIKKTSFYNSQLTFLQAKETLSSMLKQMDIKELNLYDLKIEDIDKISRVLHFQEGSRKLRVISPGVGIALLPIKVEGTGGSEKKIGKGDQIKQGDVLVLIGGLAGLSIHVNVSEFDINQLHAGQSVTVTGSAFPDVTLHGSIIGVDHQAQVMQGGVPSFSAEIVVPKLTLAEQAAIHVGMSAKVEVKIEEPPQITLPINAVIEKNGVTIVKVEDPQTKEIQEVVVKTGKTTKDSVVIITNLKVGDKVVVAD